MAEEKNFARTARTRASTENFFPLTGPVECLPAIPWRIFKILTGLGSERIPALNLLIPASMAKPAENQRFGLAGEFFNQ